MTTVFYKDGTSNMVNLKMTALSDKLWERVSFTEEGDVGHEYEFVDGKWEVK